MRVLVSLAMLVVFGCHCFAQGVPVTQDDIQRNDLERRMSNMRLSDTLVRKEAEARKRQELTARKFRPELTPKLADSMKVDEEVMAKYQSYASGSGFGIVKILNQIDCKKQKELRDFEKCLQNNANILEYANSFSFREAKLALFARSDVALGGGFLIAGRYSVQTILVNLGDIRLDSLKLESPGVKHLYKFQPSEAVGNVDKEFALYKNGVTVASFAGGSEPRKYSYGKVSKVSPDTTYALRSISYRPVGADPLAKDKDVIVVFRIVALEANGDATIIWKELSRTTGRVMRHPDEPATKSASF